MKSQEAFESALKSAIDEACKHHCKTETSILIFPAICSIYRKAFTLGWKESELAMLKEGYKN